MNEFHSKLCQRSAKFAQRLCTIYLVFYCWLRLRFVGLVSVKIYANRNAVFPNISLETIHRRDRALILIKPAVNSVCCIVYIGHEYTLRSPVFKPLVM